MKIRKSAFEGFQAKTPSEGLSQTLKLNLAFKFLVILNLIKQKGVSSNIKRKTRGDNGGEVSPALFQKLEKRFLFLENNTVIVSILGSIAHCKCGFKNFQEKKTHLFSLQAFSFTCCR